MKLVCCEYLIEKFSEVLNVHHHYSIVLLINVFSLLKYYNEETKLKLILNISLNNNDIAALGWSRSLQ